MCSQIITPTPKPKPDKGVSLAFKPLPLTARFADDRYYIWCGSMVRDDAGKCHLFYSRWPRELGHEAWVSDSQVAYAVSDDVFGPYRHVNVALPRRSHEFWDGMCTHNPIVCRFEERYYMYYMGTTGTSQPRPGHLSWEHRNNQRIGVAWADDPTGPWHRTDTPLIKGKAGEPDAICCSNPTVIKRPDGRYMMIYKAVGDQKPGPFYGPVVHMVALADHPTGPFIKQPQTVFSKEGVNFPAEDPCIWWQDDRYWAVVKDMAGYFTNAGKSLALFESIDGLQWNLAENVLVSKPQVQWMDGTQQKLHSLERPQVYLENGRPVMLLCAADITQERQHSFNLQIPLN